MVMENRYDKYKDSGIAWIGEIPEHWEIRKLKNIFLLSTGTTPKEYDKISEGDNLINWYTPSDILEGCNDLFSSLRKLSERVIYENKISLFPIGTLLYVGIGASAGKVGYANENGYSNQQITGLIPLECYSRFYFYYLSVLKDKIRDNAFFTTLPIINNVYLGQELLPYPLLSEQQSIATYLDQKCSEIDELITLQEEMITKLQSYKPSVIREAVTKGLDKNVPLKDSGIEWIGEIPENWDITKIKNHYNVILGKMVERNNDSSTGGGNYLCAANIKWNGVDTEINKKMYFSDVEKEKYLLQYNDVLIMEGGMAGTTCLYKNEFSPCYVQNSVNVCRAKKDFNNKFLYYWMYVPYYNGYIDTICNKATIKHYTKEKVQNTPILVPPLSEQQSIANYLYQKCSEIDELISIKQQKIEKLKDYKKSLIFECVTGKRKVS